jgi:hypothetical protein
VNNQAQSMPSQCPNKDCRSTRRGPYRSREVQAFAGEHNGRPYTHIVRRRTVCLDCGQARIDRSYENWPNGDPGEAHEGDTQQG